MQTPAPSLVQPRAAVRYFEFAHARWLLAAAVLSLGACLRLDPMLRDAVLGDELFTLRVVTLPWREAWHTIVADVVHPPLYYVLLRGWSAILGDAPLALRSFSLCASLATIALTMALARRWTGDARMAIVAGLLVTLSDAQIDYAHEARSYALYCALALVFLSASDRALAPGACRGDWVRFACAGWCLVMTHYVGWLFVAASGIAAAARSLRTLRAWFCACELIALGFAPWVIAVSDALSAKGGLDENLGWVSAPSAANWLWVQARFCGVAPIVGGASLAIAAALALLASALGTLRGAPRDDSRTRRVLLAAGAALVPPFLLFLATRPGIELPVWGLRHLLPAQAAWALVAALGLARWLDAAPRRTWLAACAAVALQAAPTASGLGERRFPAFDLAARRLAELVPPGERVFTISDHSVGGPLAHYLEQRRLVERLPEAPGGWPRRFWLISRPRVESDTRRAGEVSAAGWVVEREERIRGTHGSASELALTEHSRP